MEESSVPSRDLQLSVGGTRKLFLPAAAVEVATTLPYSTEEMRALRKHFEYMHK